MAREPERTAAPVESAFDRESLRAKLRVWTELQRKIALERVVEHLPDTSLEAVLNGLVHLDEHRFAGEPRTPTMDERIEAHVAATRRGDFRSDYVLRNAHGQREPWQTTAWLAATAHLFDCALEHVRSDACEATLASLRRLSALVSEVDERYDELVVFEDGSAHLSLGHELRLARELLAPHPSSGAAP